MITFSCTILANIHLIHLDQHSVTMVATRSAPKKASKASKSSYRSTGKFPAGVTKPRKAPKATKARRTREGRFVPATPSPGTISPEEIPETNLDVPRDVRPPIDQLKRLLAQWEGDENTRARGQGRPLPPATSSTSHTPFVGFGIGSGRRHGRRGHQ